ncbi:dienelactone hydrolase family protein [Leptolyngbya sp. NIES-2104]|uniref:dienelactone hydrolase family protein n=1 Tax=Leptolyngbya sp. NIES-2104 TaxID=1552121 RepID=UPI0006EC9276|nr:dienelactone hydrolase family protein [Leptolyngbya sp. NIES-2104]GAP99263.1 candidate 1: dienelactone hydrolase [Leptolyngbya sp. NIES-2104]
MANFHRIEFEFRSEYKLLRGEINTIVNSSWIKLSNGDLQIDAYLSEPDTAAQGAMIVIQEIFGVNSHIRSITERFAQEGYVAIAPAIFQRTAPGFEVGYSEDDTKLGRSHKDQTTADQLLSDLRTTIAFLQTKGFQEVGAIGFCFGGHVAYLAATLPEVKATASFYGAGIATMTPGGGAPTITRTSEIKGTLYAFFGTQDPLISIEQIDQVEAALEANHIDHKVFRYSAGHGFFCDQRSDYHPEAAADAWEQVKALFSRLTH